MKSTLHLKFILLYIILGFLSIFTVASLSSTLTTHYLESSISGNMYQSANLLASNYLPDYFSKTIALADVYTQLNGMSDYLNSDIWFVDNEGSLLASAKSGDVSYAPSRIENFDPAESGGSTYLTGDYHGYFNSEMITVIAPVTENFSTHGYLLVHKPYSQITDAHSVLMRNTYIVILIIYVLSFIILLGVHFLIYRPLVKITNAAKQYASGNLDVVIPVNTQDEIGYLSASLNYMSSQLVGAFYQPKMVLIDPDVLETLPDRYVTDGMGEIIKYGCIKDRKLFDLLEKCGCYENLKEHLTDVIATCVDIKRRVVEEDEFDTGERILLNFGHTLAHTIEQHFHYERESHGEAVAIGMYQITKIAEEKGLTKKGEAEHIRKVLEAYKLPVKADVPLPQLTEAIKLDKKTLNNKLKVVLLHEIGDSYTYPTGQEFFDGDRTV